jgi:hypothetical protein
MNPLSLQMKNNNPQSEKKRSAAFRKSRRAFIKNGAALTALAAGGSLAGISPLQAVAGRQPAEKKMNGIQVGAVSFADEGVENVLDILEGRGSVNTLFLTTFTHGRGLSGRQIPGQPFPDHGSQESDEKTFHGGNYATPHPEFYKNTVLKGDRAPELGGFDVLASVIPAAKKRGMKVFASVEDQWRSDVPGVTESVMPASSAILVQLFSGMFLRKN